MNLKDILKKEGLEIVTEVSMKYLKVKFTEEELNRKLKSKALYDYNLKGIFNVEISEMGFNGYGNLYLVLTCLDDEHFKKGDTFEVIEC